MLAVVEHQKQLLVAQSIQERALATYVTGSGGHHGLKGLPGRVKDAAQVVPSTAKTSLGEFSLSKPFIDQGYRSLLEDRTPFVSLAVYVHNKCIDHKV